MRDDACADCRELDAELALDVVVGRERAHVLAHLDRCCRCQDAVAALARTTDRLIDLIPEAEAPATLERRVVAALPAVAPRRTHRRGPRIATAVAGLVAALAGWMGAGSPASQPPFIKADLAAVISAPLLTDGRPVGEAYFYPGTPGWLRLEIDVTILPEDNPITCAVLSSDQTQHVIGVFTAAPGHDVWSATVPANAHPVAGATVIDRNGTTLGAARFAASPAAAKTTTPRRPILPTSISPGTDRTQEFRPGPAYMPSTAAPPDVRSSAFSPYRPPRPQPSPPPAAARSAATDLLDQHAHRTMRATEPTDETKPLPRPPGKSTAAPAASRRTPDRPDPTAAVVQGAAHLADRPPPGHLSRPTRDDSAHSTDDDQRRTQTNPQPATRDQQKRHADGGAGFDYASSLRSTRSSVH
ncbi:MAG: hypothetical protein JOY78_09845 [Pseudonocardia sp.]|nr:hypothetical protein [Pseudonocardia sp.]